MRLRLTDRESWIVGAVALAIAAARPGEVRADTVAVGAAHVLVVTDTGIVYAFGANGRGQAGQPAESDDVAKARLVRGLSGIRAVAAGVEHSLALDRRGHVWSLGGNSFQQLGIEGVEFTTTPTLVPGLSDVVAIAAGDFHSLAVTRAGALYAWGRGDEGQLDNGSMENRSTPTLVRGLSGVVGVAAGGSHTLAVLGPLDGGALKVFGRNLEGQAGDGTRTPAANPVMADALRGVVLAAAGGRFSLAVTSHDRTHSWGANERAQLGRETGSSDASVGVLESLRSPLALAAGGSHALAITSSRTVVAWGDDMGLAEVPGLVDVVAIAAGGVSDGSSDGQSVAVTARGEVFTWTPGGSPAKIADAGFVWRTQSRAETPRVRPRETPVRPPPPPGTESLLADPVLSLSSGTFAAGTPVTLTCASPGAEIHYTINGVDPTMNDLFVMSGGTLVVGNYTLKAKAFKAGDTPSGVVSAVYTVTGTFTPGMAVTGASFSVFLVSDGTVWVTGDNQSGQLGTGSGTPPSRMYADRVAGLTGVVAIAAGNRHALALRSDQTLWAWGNDQYGQIGDGTPSAAQLYPYKVNLANVVAIAAGDYHSLAVTSAGAAYSFGDNSQGQLGLGHTNPISVPTQVSGLTGVTSVAGGDVHSLALKSDGSVASFGDNLNGQLGTGDGLDHSSPVTVPYLAGITAIASGVGAQHSLALRGDGVILAFGSNSNGQLGVGSTQASSVPIAILEIPFVVQIAAGRFHSLAITLDSEYWGWGQQSNGQVGDPTQTGNILFPVALEGPESGVHVGAGETHSAAVTADGRIFVWGNNVNGTLGDGTLIVRKAPTLIADPGFHWKAGTPTFNVNGGTYSQNQNVTLSCAHTGATIRYTTDGTEPTSTTGTVYTAGVPVPVTVSLTLTAKAFRSDLGDSNPADEVYELKPAAPVFDPTGGVKPAPVNVTITSTTSGATIRYTLDGSDPGPGSTLYTVPVNIATTTTLKAKAFRTDWTDSNTTTATYTMNFGTAAAPTMNPGTGTYVGSVSVTLSSATSGATILYSTDGGNPALVYTAPVVLSQNATLKAKATHPDYTASSITSTAYQVQLLAPTLTPGTGTYTLGQAVTVSHGEPGVTLRYTVDGTDPTGNDPIVAVGAVLRPVATNTLRVRAFKSTNVDSAVTSATYTMSGTVTSGAVAAGDSYSAVIRPGPTVWGFGLNSSSQIGQGNLTTPVKVPTQVSGLTNASAVAAGTTHALVLKSDATAWGYGTDNKGQLGQLATATNRSTPVQVLQAAGTPLANITAVAAGNLFSVVLRSDNTVWAFGQNNYGQLGFAANGSANATPAQVAGLTGVAAVAAGTEHTIVLKSDSTVWAFGRNNLGQLGNNLTADSSTPVQVKKADLTNLTGVVAIAAGANHNLALKSDGTLVAWGYNQYGQAGTGNTTTPLRTANAVLNLSGVYSISAGFNHSLAAARDGSLFAWGLNSLYQLGDGVTTNQSRPEWIAGPSGVVSTEGGDDHSLARAFDAALWGWGTNANYQVGDGSNVVRKTPVTLATPSQWQVATPTFSPAGAAFTSAQTVTLNCETSGATVYYTLDGSTPTTSSSSVSPGGTVAVGQTLTLKAMAGKAGMANSNLRSDNYTFNLPTPAFTPAGGSYGTPQTVSINYSVAGAEVRYTTNGTTPTPSSSLYSAAFNVDASVTLKAKAFKSEWTDSLVGTGTYTLTVATPLLAPGGGTYSTPQTVTVSTATTGATLHYTTTGMEPNQSSPTIASGGTIPVAAPTILMVKGFKPGWTTSGLTTGIYVLNAAALATPTFTPPAGTYGATQQVTISTTSPAATLRYTIDGTDPTFTSPLYTGPLSVDWTMTLKARAFRSEATPSASASAAYTVNLANTVAPPSMSPAPGIHATRQTVTLSSATSGSTIYYTTDGTAPIVGTSPSVATGGSVSIDASAILRAVATKAEMTASPARRGDYQITGAVQAGYQHALVLKTNRTVWGWGINANGQLGTGGTTPVVTPTQATGLTDAVMIATFAEGATGGTSLALLSNGTVMGWGRNNWAQTGIGSTTPANVLTPTAVPGLSGVVAVSAGHGHGLALKSDSTVWAWGLATSGQVGNNTTAPSPVLTPTQVMTGPSTYLTDVVAIAVGSYFSMALTRDGTVVAWGQNTSGQLGDGTQTQRTVATPVVGMTGVVAIAAGRDHALALKTNGEIQGSLWAWGQNSGFALGPEAPTFSATPIVVASDVSAIGAGNTVSLLVRNQPGAQTAIWGAGVTGAHDLIPLGAQGSAPLMMLVNGDFVAVDGDGQVKLGLKRDTTVFPWGSAYAHYGDGFALGTGGAGSQDPDGDGLSTAQEWALGTDPLNPDTNGDGIPDGIEVQIGLSPTNLDMDADGVLNQTELQNGTDPFRADTDGDSVNDGADCFPLDPTRSTCPPVDPNDHTAPVITLTEPTNAVLISVVPPL